MMENIRIQEVTSENIDACGIYCIKNSNSLGSQAKKKWYLNRIAEGLKIRLAMDANGKQLGMIESVPAEYAWRPIHAVNYLYIQCLIEFSKSSQKKGIGSSLIKACEEEARYTEKSGIFTLVSSGSWMAGKGIFEKNGYEFIERKGRFELWSKTFNNVNKLPKILNYELNQKNYQGWNLLYSDQCPWHAKAAVEIQKKALEKGVKLNIQRIETAAEAQNGPSGFGTFSLIKDGKLLEDHYISATRFENILRKELGN